MSKQPPPAPTTSAAGPCPTVIQIVGWLVGYFGFNGPLRQYFSLYRAVSQREGERRERIDESKNVQTTPTRTYCKRNRPLPYCNQNCRTPRHWKFTQHHRTTRPPPPPQIVGRPGTGCVRQWFRTAEPLGERRYENWNTHRVSFCLLITQCQHLQLANEIIRTGNSCPRIGWINFHTFTCTGNLCPLLGTTPPA